MPQHDDRHTPTDLRSIRREVRAARRTLTATTRQGADDAINERAIELAEQAGARRVSSYLSTDGEPDLAELHEWCASAGVEVSVPVMGADGSLEFRVLGAGDLRVNPSGIPEPDAGEAASLADLDVIYTPLVLFDSRANRIGRGGGWYDRALAGRHDRQVLAGVAYELQRREHLPIHAGDVPLDIVLTEAAVYRRRP